MKVQEVMNTKPEYLNATDSIFEAARRMQKHACGFEPIAKDNKLIGVVTDRDIALRGLADGKTSADPVTTVMSGKTLYCYQEDDIKEVLKNMGEQNVQRLVVLKSPEQKDLVGIIALSDIAEHCKDDGLAMEIAECCKRYH